MGKALTAIKDTAKAGGALIGRSASRAGKAVVEHPAIMLGGAAVLGTGAIVSAKTKQELSPINYKHKHNRGLINETRRVKPL